MGDISLTNPRIQDFKIGSNLKIGIKDPRHQRAIPIIEYFLNNRRKQKYSENFTDFSITYKNFVSPVQEKLNAWNSVFPGISI